ncbi:AAA family ATPase [Haloarculaceae archaeon H-GB2-1]|nr:AAA family ATPase [Haloarculaceae archaeon H-GB2-1]
MITNHEVLEPTFVPQDLHHRDGKIEAVSAALGPVTRGYAGEDVLLFGPSGSGKTTLSKFVLQQLDGEAQGVRTAYVNAIGHHTTTAALDALLTDANLAFDLHPESTSVSSYYRRLQDCDEQVVAVIDEVDVLAEYSLLLSLYDQPNVTMVLICVDEDALFCELDERVRSRLRSAQTVRLAPFSVAELRDILWNRVDAGLDTTRVNPVAVARIAEVAGGDARLGLSMLRQAAKYVVENDEVEVTPRSWSPSSETVATLRPRW